MRQHIQQFEKKRPRLAFSGVGWIGRNRLQAAVDSELAEVMLVSDPSRECIDEALKLAPSARPATSFEETIQDPEIDAVVIATPSALHMEQAVAAFEMGKAVFCQKPLGRNAEEVSAVIASAARADRKLGADFSYRYTAAFQSILPVIRSGELGTIFAADLVFHNAYGPDKPWFYDIRLAGGGCVLDLGIHLVDLVLLAFGYPEVTRVKPRLYAKGVQVKGNEVVEDYANVQITLGNDVDVRLACSWNLHAGREAVIEASFYGTAGGVAMKNVNGSFYHFKAERFNGTAAHTLTDVADSWGGKALVDWIGRIANDPVYDVEADHYVASAKVVDRIYGKD